MRKIAFASLLLLAVPASAATLDDLAFMEGRWENEDRTIAEWWMPGDGRAMVGSFRWTMEERSVLEFLVIEQTETGPVYRFKHFNPDYVTWEDDEPNTLELTEHDESRAVFRAVNPREGAPGHLIYRREGDMMFICVDAIERPETGCGGFELELQRRGD